MENKKYIEQLLLKGSGRNRADVVADAIIQRPDLFPELVRIYLGNENEASRVAAWATDLIVEQHPEWIHSYIEEMTAALPRFRHDAFKRHTLRMLMRLPLPVEGLGTLLRVCFDWLVRPHEAAAQKVYAMELLYRVYLTEPDLGPELADSIRWRMDEETPGFRCKAEKILKKISR